MISVGIDVSKDKSTVCFLKPCGEVLVTPYDVLHTQGELTALVERIRSYDEEARVILEDTGHYHFPIVKFLLDNPKKAEEIGLLAYETIAKEWNAAEAAKRLLTFYEEWKQGEIHLPKSGPFSEAPVIAPKKMYEYMMEGSRE